MNKDYAKFQYKIIEHYLKFKKPKTHAEKQYYVNEFVKQYSWLVRYIYTHFLEEIPTNTDLEKPQIFDKLL